MLESLRFHLWRARDAVRGSAAGQRAPRGNLRVDLSTKPPGRFAVRFGAWFRRRSHESSARVCRPAARAAGAVAPRCSLRRLRLDAACGGSLDASRGRYRSRVDCRESRAPRVRRNTIRPARRVTDPLPGADAILCRDFLIHLPTRLIRMTLANFMVSDARWLLMTNHAGAQLFDIQLGSVQADDSGSAPRFLFPQPHRMLRLQAAPPSGNCVSGNDYVARLLAIFTYRLNRRRPFFSSLCESAAAAAAAPSDARRHRGQIANRLTNCSSSRSCASIP